MACDYACRYTADAGIGTPPQEEQGGACHNDSPANGADSVFAAMIRDSATSKDEMMIVNGDISYARGWPWIWERYFDLIQPLATAMPWMVRAARALKPVPVQCAVCLNMPPCRWAWAIMRSTRTRMSSTAQGAATAAASVALRL